MTRILLILLLSLTAFGQPSPINRRAMAIAGLVTKTNELPGQIIFRWKGSDLTNSPPTVWLDEIQGIPMFTSNGPTWSVDHMIFSRASSQYTATPTALPVICDNTAASMSVLLVASHHQTIAAGAWMGSTNTTDYANISTAPLELRWGTFSLGGMAANVKFDILFNITGVFTNNILSATNRNDAQTALKYFGVHIPPNTAGLDGSIYEVIVWTNTVLSASDRDWVHRYVTNTYSGISP